MSKPSKNEKLLKSFTKFCEKYPEQRFYQALRNWMEVPYLFVGDKMASEVIGGRDTFYWEEKKK